MHVYGELTGRLTAGGTIKGMLTVPTSVVTDVYDGEYTVIPKAHEAQVLETAQKLLLDDVTVTKVPYYETSNIYDGKTVYIAEDSNGD